MPNQKRIIKNVLIIICIFAFGLILIQPLKTELFPQEKKYGLYGTGMDVLQDGITSGYLWSGREEILRCDEHNGLRLYVSEQGVNDSGEHYIIGNMDYMIFADLNAKDMSEMQYVILKNQLTVTYREEAGKRIVTDIQLESFPGGDDTLFFNEPVICQLDNFSNYIWAVDEPMGGIMQVDFNATQFNLADTFLFEFKMSFTEDNHIQLHIKSFEDVSAP